MGQAGCGNIASSSRTGCVTTKASPSKAGCVATKSQAGCADREEGHARSLSTMPQRRQSFNMPSRTTTSQHVCPADGSHEEKAKGIPEEDVVMNRGDNENVNGNEHSVEATSDEAVSTNLGCVTSWTSTPPIAHEFASNHSMLANVESDAMATSRVNKTATLDDSRLVESIRFDAQKGKYAKAVEGQEANDKNNNHDTPSTIGTISGNVMLSDKTFGLDTASNSYVDSHREEAMRISDKHAMHHDASVGTDSLHPTIESSMQTDFRFDCAFSYRSVNDRNQVDGLDGSTPHEDANCEQSPTDDRCKSNFTSGDLICLVGLTSEGGSKLNGRRGILLKFEDSRQRWQVKLKRSREVKLVRSVNLSRPSTKELVSCLCDSFIPEDDLKSFVGDNTCAICMDEFSGSAITITRCGHIFHMRCLARARTSTCPQCRQSIDDPSADVVPEPDPASNREIAHSAVTHAECCTPGVGCDKPSAVEYDSLELKSQRC